MTAGPPVVRPRTALIADDDPGQRLLMEQALSQAGFGVVAVADGAAAVEQALAATPAIIFLDVVMPRKTGLEACREIRAALRGPRPPGSGTVAPVLRPPYVRPGAHRADRRGADPLPLAEADP
jgi:CheY-like chemotaxis protein